MDTYKKRNRSDSGVNAQKKYASMHETELVLKLKKDDLFDPYIMLPHAELNKAVYSSVDSFVEKYEGDTLSISVCTDPVNHVVQNLFREVYCAHYEDELQKTARYLKRHYIRVIVLLVISVLCFLLCNHTVKFLPDETIFSYLIGNIGCFCLWEVGYTHFAARDAVHGKKRITRALNATIDFE